MSTKNIFITGASGKIGRFLINSLLSKDYNIFALCREKNGEYDDPKIKFVIGDLLKPDSYVSALRGIDIVVHMGAITHTNNVSKYYEVNSEGTLHLLKRCEPYGVKRFIFISTRAISAQGGDYSRSKLIAESHVQKSGLDWIILRLAEVYGVSGNEGVDILLNHIHRFPVIPVIGDGEYTINPVHISDVVFSILETIERVEIKDKIYTIAGPESFTYNKFIDKILKKRRSKRIKVHLPLHIFRILMRISALIMKDGFLAMDQLPRLISEKSDDISSAMRDLSFKPARIEDMVNKR